MGFHKEVKGSEIAPAPTVVSHKNTKALRHNTYTKNLGQSPIGSWISENSDESRIVDSVGQVLGCPGKPQVEELGYQPSHKTFNLELVLPAECSGNRTEHNHHRDSGELI